MSLSKTSPEFLADKIISTLGKELTYPDLSSDGAGKSALLQVELLKKNHLF